MTLRWSDPIDRVVLEDLFGRGKSLSELANNGPADDTQLLPASSRAEPVHRLHAVRVIPADEAAWAKDCPSPEGWTS